MFQLAELAKFARKPGFGRFDLQTRYSESAIWPRAPTPSKPSPHKAILLVLAFGISDPENWSRSWQ
jgi:hypothetical protein